MIKYKIITTKNFEEEFENLFHYLCFFLKEPPIAKRFYNKILFEISKLEYLPERNPKLLYFSNKYQKILRKILISNYIIIYEINYSKKEIYILHIFQNRQNYFYQL